MALPKGGLVRGHDKPIHGSCAIHFPGGIIDFSYVFLGVHPSSPPIQNGTNQDSGGDLQSFKKSLIHGIKL